MKFCNTLLAVRDMAKSLQFYKELFEQEVVLDLGANKTLTCGLVLQEGLDQIAGFSADTMKFGSNTMELYFEAEDFDGFMKRLDAYPQVRRLHEPKTYPWLQKGIHILDPDGHLIEVSESMYVVAGGQFEQGKSVEETSRLIQHPVELVQSWYERYRTAKQALISVCGTDCGMCSYFGNMCSGCNACEGRVFHAPEGKACPIYHCVKHDRGMHDCGECGEAPCAIWMKTRDPKLPDEEFHQNVAMRIKTLHKE